MQKNTYQFIRFALVGGLNTAIDFAVLNILIAVFGLGENNGHYSIFKVISFIASVTNSFILNKFWVFKRKELEPKDTKKELLSFLSVSLVGLLINTGISSLVFHIGSSIHPDISSTIWANAGALTGTIVVLIFNFFGYKIFVFKQKAQ